MLIKKLVRKKMDVNEHERISYFTFGCKLKQANSTTIAVLHFTVTVGSSIKSTTLTPKLVQNVALILFGV